MKIQQNLNSQIQNNKKEHNSPIAFRGGEGFTQFLNFLDINQTMGATAVDVGCMGLPRTAVDFTRNPEAGTETMRREFSATINNALIGAYGLGAAWLLSKTFNNKFGVQAHKMFIPEEMLDFFSNTWNETKDVSEFVETSLENVKGYNPDLKGCDSYVNGYVGLDTVAQSEFKKEMLKVVKGKSQELDKDTHSYLKALFLDATGAESRIKLEKQFGDKNIKSVSSLDDFIKNLFKMSKNFMNNEVVKTFNANGIENNVFIKGLKNLNVRNSLLGLALAMTVGLSVQPLNMYLTKKKTGKEGFVGVEGKESDKSTKFKLIKIGVATAAAVAALLTIGKSPKQIIKNIQFKGLIPTINQFRLVYGATIVSRLLSSRDKNELRESGIKDSLGFANWLIFGGFVSKLVAMGFDKLKQFKNDKFLRYNAEEDGEGFAKKLLKSSTVTREEIFHSALKKMGISTIKENGLAMTFKEMVKALKKAAKEGAPEAAEVASAALKKNRYLGLIQISGYLYSGLVLGIGITKLNIAITNAIEKRRKAQKAA